MKGLTGLGLAAAGVALVLHNLPYLVRDQAVIWLQHQGVEEVELTALEVDWLSGQLNLRGLRMASAGYETVALENLHLALDYTALADRQIRLTQVSVQGLRGRYRDNDQGRWLGPLALDPLLQSGHPDAQEQAEASSAQQWAFGLQAFSLQDIRWVTELGADEYPLVIDQLSLSPLRTWAPDTLTELAASGTLLGADFSLQLSATPLAQNRNGDIQLSLKRLPLQALPHPGLETLQGWLSAELTADFRYGADGRLNLQPQGQLELHKGRAKVAGLQARFDDFNWQGQLELNYSGEQLALEHNGQLHLAGLNAAQGEQTLRLAELKLDGSTRWLGLVQGQLNHQGLLTVSDLEGRTGVGQAQLEAFSWQGESELKLTTTSPQVKQQGQLEVSGLQLRQLPQLNAKLTSARVPLTWQWADTLTAQLTDLQLSGLNLSSPEQSYTLASLGSAELGSLELRSESLTLEQLHLDQLKLAESGQAPLTALDQVRLNRLQADPTRADIGTLDIRGSRTYLVRGTQGEMQDIERLQRVLATLATRGNTLPEAAAEAAREVDSPAQYQWQLAGVEMHGQNTLEFADRSVQPNFDAQMDLQQLSLGALSNRSAQATPFVLKGVLNRFGQLALKGEVAAFAEPISGRWEGGVHNAELPPLSPYSIPLLGYFLRSGQLSITTEGTIDQGRIEGKNQIRLANVTVRPEASDQVSKVTKRLSMPLETALALLSDSRDNIKLDVPVSGSLANPEFGYQSIIQRIAEKGVKQAAFSFLTQALQPYGTLISLARTAATSDLQTAFIRLSPVSFAPGEVELDSQARDYLTKISDMLLEKKGLRLNVCGVASPEDRVALAPQVAELAAEEEMDAALQAQTLEARLRTLASLRAEQVKSQLQLNISADRLFTCYAKVLDEPEGELRGPRVELAL